MATKRYSCICCGVLLAVLVFCMPVFTSAAERPANTLPVKVAFFPMVGFYEKDSAGKYTGYGVEYLNAMEQCSNLTFEYVDAGTWQNAIEMLRSGKVDILAPAQKTEVRETEFIFLTYPMSYEYGGVMTLETRNDLHYEDFSTFSSLTLGCTKGQVFEDDYRFYAADNGFTAKKILYYDTWPDLNHALETGKVDAVITNMMYDAPPRKILARFGVSKAYIVVRPDRADIIPELEAAVSRINMESPNYIDQLTNKYYPHYKKVPFTQRELDYIASAPTIRVLCPTNEAPFSHLDAKVFHGVTISLLERIGTLSGLKFEYLPVTTRSEMRAALQSGKGDLIASDTYDFNWARQENVYQIAPYMSAQLIRIVGEANGTAAMVPDRFATEYVKERFPNIKLLSCDSVEDCIRAVQDGKAGFTIINSYETNFILNRFPGMLVHEESMGTIQQLCMSVSKDTAPELRSILGKSLGRISDAEIYEYVAQNASRHREISFSGLIVNYPVRMMLLFIVAILILAALVYAIGMNRMKAAKNKELEIAVRKAVQASRSKSDFLSNMSHDIRTPMNAIINLTNLAREDIHNETLLLSDLDKIKISSDFLLSLINDILDMSRIENRQFQLSPKVYTAQRFVNYLNSLMAPLFSAKDIRFVIDIEKRIPAIYVDEVRFNQIFFNVLSNAAKYTPNGGTVTFSTKILQFDESHFHGAFSITDTGIGMSEAFLSKAFEPFEREKAVEAYVGTGLGLSITKAIVDAMGGTIELKSTKGKGTTVTIVLDLPLPDANMLSASLQREKMDEIHALGFEYSGKVLVAEDHPLNQEIITRLLQRKGFSVECVENGALAVERIKTSPDDTYLFILMDIRMPVMDGLTATKQIRELENRLTATIPIIAMTADAFVEDRNRCLAAGMDAYISKPVNLSELLGIIKKILDEQNIRKRPKILVVDDVEVNIAVVKAALENEFDVLTATNGPAALQYLAERTDIIAVITDIQMPGMNGLELIERIRADSRLDNISILANTQYGDPRQEEQLLLSGTDDFVYKPTTPSILLTRLYNILKRKHPSRKPQKGFTC